MPPRVYEVRDRDRERLAADLAEDRTSRCSIWIREARHFGLDRDAVFVVLEGDEAVLEATEARVLAYGRVPAEAERILGWVRWEDDASATGIGSVFGPVADPPPSAPRPALTAWRKFWEWLKA